MRAETAEDGHATETGAEAAPLAGVLFPPRFPVNALLSRVADRLSREGVAVAGVVQDAPPRREGEPPNLVMRGLREGWELPILEIRGSQAQGCRLDPRAIADVAGRLEADVARGCDLLVVNRFGRSEAEGDGLRSVLERAAFDGIPILIGVRADYAPAWEAFHGGLGVALPPEEEAILHWWRALRA